VRAEVRQLGASETPHILAVDRPVGQRIAHGRHGAEGTGPRMSIRLVVVEQDAIGVKSDDWFHGKFMLTSLLRFIKLRRRDIP